jgi:probable phosphoglycerate mutase
MKAILSFDGGSRPTNPGHAGFAALVWMEGKPDPVVCSRYLGYGYTNNVAEFSGLIVGIKLAHHLKATKIYIKSDSKLVINHVTGEWICKKDDLKLLRNEARKLLAKHFPDEWEFKWVQRSKNNEADEYCTKAIWYGMNLNPLTPKRIRNKRPGKVYDPWRDSVF